MLKFDKPLFSERDLDDLLRSIQRFMSYKIDRLTEEDLTQISVEEHYRCLRQEYGLVSVTLNEDQITADYKEILVDVSGDPRYKAQAESSSSLVKGTGVDVYIPFTGDERLLKCRPSSLNVTPPEASINSNEIKLTYEFTDLDRDAIKTRCDSDIALIKSYLEQIAHDVAAHNELIHAKVHEKIEARLKALVDNRSLIATLGFQIRRKGDAPKTYNIPIPRKALRVPASIPSTTSYVPEPTISSEDYEDIIAIITGMAKVMEMSPEAFRNMKEEDLRTHFLVQLNGQYEGQATGETFNIEGKTDILVRAGNNNIFIAECKFWKGPKSLSDAIDQLLSYTTWRDTKTALLVFNRGKNLSTILKSIPQVVKAHPSYKRSIPYNLETGFRSILSHRDDPNRELTLTVLVFEVPE